MLNRRLFYPAIVASLLLVMPSPAVAQGRDQCTTGTVTSNETWTRMANPHHVMRNCRVSNSTITLEAGVIVLLGPGVDWTFGPGSRLVASGLDNGRIRIRAISDTASPGTWGQLRFEAGSGDSVLEFVDVTDGGRDGAPMVSVEAPTVVMGSQPAANINLRFANAGGVPLAMAADSVGPSLARAGEYALTQVCRQVRFDTTNTMNAIQVLASGGADVTRSTTWHDFCVPYLVEDILEIGGPEEPTLQLDAGTTLRFGRDGGLRAGLGPENLGQLETVGTPEKPVVFTGIEEEPGSWQGLDLTEHSVGHILNTVHVLYGGRGGRPMVRVTSDNTYALHSRFMHALQYPVEVVPAAVEPFLGALATALEPPFVDNGVQRILVAVTDQPAVSSNSSWPAVGIPFEPTDSIVIAAATDRARMRVEAGATILFRPDTELVVGEPALDDRTGRGRGVLWVEGTVGREAVLAGLTDEPGAWLGIRATSAADEIILSAAEVRHGGSTERPMVTYAGAAGQVVGSALVGAPGYPLSVPLDNLEVLVGDQQRQPGSANVLQGNGTDRFLVEPAPLPNSGRFIWHDPGAPLEVQETLAVNVAAFATLEVHDGLTLAFRPEAGLILGTDATRRGELLVVNDDPELPVRLLAADPEAGWQGVTVNQRSRVTGADLAVSGTAEGRPGVHLDRGELDVRALSIQGAKGIGLHLTGTGASAVLTRSRIRDNRIGIQVDVGGLRVTESTIMGNAEAGVVNNDRTRCARATRVFWGSPAGPNDPSDAEDGCGGRMLLNPGNDLVSDYVEWFPYATDQVNYTPVPGGGADFKIMIPLARKP